jgi:Ice-binding-like
MRKIGHFSVFSFVILSLAILSFSVSSANADGILGPDLTTFSVLGASTVTNTGATTLTGDLGVSPGSAITGESTITVNGTSAAMIGNPFVHSNDAVSISAQSELAAAKTELGSLGGGTLLPANLGGLTLSPGVYTVPAGTTNLTGTLTLNGQGNLNAFWVFQMPSTLITSPGSVVNVINTGAGAGLFWNVGSSATLDTTTSFEGNILALTSITLDTGATDQCGRALAHTGAVTMDTNTISIGCTNLLGGTTGTGAPEAQGAMAPA